MRVLTVFPVCCILMKVICKVTIRYGVSCSNVTFLCYLNLCVQVTTRAGIRATEITGARAMETKATATVVIVDTITMTTPLVTMDTVLDMITVSKDECAFCRSVHFRCQFSCYFLL